MLRRFYTVMVVPNEGGELTRLSVSQNFVVSLASIFLFCFVSSAFLAHFFLNGMNQVDDAEQYRVESERLTVETAQVHASLYRTVVKMEELLSRLEEYGGLQEWTSEGGVPTNEGIGGLEPGADPLEADWRGMARAVQERSDFWSAVLEQQICDRTSYLRSLPTIWPVHGRLASGYQYRRDPITGARQFHSGIDVAAPRGTPILAAADGVVEEARRKGGYGNCVVIDHGNGLKTLYAHMSRMHVKEGDAVGRADQIGEVGSTGRSVGPHLHFEIHENGTKVNPLKHYLSRKTLNDNRKPRGT